jgi:D-alanyl-D-alanine carboxypeptidase/D-alanyl-D-alanine-endopeptidase (penicillin-binding protein 4)
MAGSPIRAVPVLAGALIWALCAGTVHAQSPPAAKATGPLATRIDSILARAPYSRAHWGIAVADARTGDGVYERAADRLFIPASNLKLVVATTAAKLLGDDFTYTTRLLGGGPIRDGILDGDLVVSGTGDPTISGRYADGNRTAVLEGFGTRRTARATRPTVLVRGFGANTKCHRSARERPRSQAAARAFSVSPGVNAPAEP